MTEIYYAHSENKVGHKHRLKEHLSSVSFLAKQYLHGWMEGEVALAGVLHDLGKYGDAFQRRLRGEEQGLDHWSLGAWVALSRYRAIAAALAIQGHHIGLQNLNVKSLRELQPQKLKEAHPLNLVLSDESEVRLQTRLEEDGLSVVSPDAWAIDPKNPISNIAHMLNVRMLFSALVDADFVDTESHFKGNEEGKVYRQQGVDLQVDRALLLLRQHLQVLTKKSGSVESVAQVRGTLLSDCWQAAEEPKGLFTLTAPTGSGKTLAMLAFALAHAKKHGLKRVVMVIPFLSIIEQTAAVYRELFAEFGEQYVLEHHSLSRGGESGEDEPIEQERQRRLLAENWDAPLIITTSVQLLESLFAHRPSRCRKLHRLRESVILFDEVQTLPAKLVLPTLAALSHLSEEHGTSVVFSTATQPAFDHLQDEIKTQWLSKDSQGWQTQPIVSKPQDMFQALQRTDYIWHSPEKRWSWQRLAQDLNQAPQVLCIVNLKRHARKLLGCLQVFDKKGLFHLSTDLCPAHRQAMLREVRQRLLTGKACCLISTQCIEAGVDVDFPLLYRAYAPLEAIIQAAGRCNREGKQKALGEVHLFNPEDESYPDESYQQGAGVTKKLLRQYGSSGMRVHDPDFIDEYYRNFYDLTRVHQSEACEALSGLVKYGDFPNVAQQYRLIKQDTINVLVPYADQIELYESLREEAQTVGLSRDWMARARPLCVSVWRPKADHKLWCWLSVVPIYKAGRGSQRRDEWFIYLQPDHYDPLLGLSPPDQDDFLMC